MNDFNFHKFFSQEELSTIDILKTNSDMYKNDASEWEHPLPFDEYNLPPFPSEIFPGWLRGYIEAVAESTQTPIDAPSVIALTILSTACAQKFMVAPFGDWVEPINLYALVLLPPANRKSAVFQLLKEPITQFEQSEIQRLQIEVYQNVATRKAKEKRKEKLLAEYSNEPSDIIFKELMSLEEELAKEEQLSLPRYVVDDITQEKLVGLMLENNEKIALLSAEGGIFDIIAGRYAQNGRSNLDIFLKGHSGDYCPVDRMNRTEILKNPCLTMGLFIQPEVLRKLPDSFKGRGLMARFLYSIPKSLIGYRDIRPRPVGMHIKDSYFKNMTKLLNLPSNSSIQLTLNEEADAILKTLQWKIEMSLREEGVLSHLQDWGGKLVGQLLRVAALLHIAKHVNLLSDTNPNPHDTPTEIEPSIIKGLVPLSNYLIQHAAASYDYMDIDKEIEDAQYLLNVIKRQKGDSVEYGKLHQLTKKRFKGVDGLKKSLHLLVERRYLRRRGEGKKTFYDINPFLRTSSNSTPNTPIPYKAQQPQGIKQGQPTEINSPQNPDLKNYDVGELGENNLKVTNHDKPSTDAHSKLLGEKGVNFDGNGGMFL